MCYETVKTLVFSFDQPPKQVPSNKLPDGPVLGNGDIGAALSAQPQLGRLGIHLGKNDLWNSHSHWETPGARTYGVLNLFCPQASGTFRAQQRLADATVTAWLEGEEAAITLETRVLRQSNLMVQTLRCTRGQGEVRLELSPVEEDPEGRAWVEIRDGRIWGWKEFATPLQQWPCKACSITQVLGKPGPAFSIAAGEEVKIFTVLHTNLESECYEALCENDLAELDLEAGLRQHRRWWREFWEESALSIPSQPLLERFWYVSHYLMACCCQEGKFAPGLFGNWVTTDSPAWGGDYHLNYNYEAPWWGLYSSNHMSITEPYDQPLLDYMPAAQKAARDKLGCRGLYTLVGIGPKGLRTAALTDGQGRDDVNYWGQKSNAAYGAVNMLMAFYATYDQDYGRKIYPYLAQTARFWLDYLRWDGERYVVERDCIHENQAAARGVFSWADENTPDDGDHRNPLITLGLLRMLFQGLLDVCGECGIQAPEQGRWEDVLHHLSQFPTMLRQGRRVFRYTENATAWNEESNSLGIQHIFPAGCVGLGSDAELLEIGRETFRQLDRWEDYNAFPTYFPAGARLGIDPATLLDHLTEQIQKHGYPNGFLFFGGGGIEGCSGVPCTLNEMLLQSHEGVLRLFPVWDLGQDAAFTTLRAKGAFLVSAKLAGGEISSAQVVSERGKDCAICLPFPASLEVRCGGEAIPVTREAGVFSFSTQPGKTYHLHIRRERQRDYE